MRWLALLLVGCAAESDPEQCLTSGDRYLMSYQTLEGDCGDWPPHEVTVPESRGPRGGDLECDQLPYWEGCGVVINMNCSFAVSSPARLIQAHYQGGVTFSGPTGQGELLLDVQDFVEGSCFGRYEMTAERLSRR